jgi:hypothetical protein
MCIPQPGVTKLDVLFGTLPTGKVQLLRLAPPAAGICQISSTIDELRPASRVHRFELASPVRCGERFIIQIDGVALNAGVAVRPRTGDANSDGVVDAEDLEALRRFLGAEKPKAQFRESCADVDQDGVVDLNDAELIAKALDEGTDARLVPLPDGTELWSPGVTDSASIAALTTGMGDQRNFDRANYAALALFSIGSAAVPGLIAAAANANDQDRFKSNLLQDVNRTGRPWSEDDTPLADAYLLLVEAIRQQKIEVYIDPWFIRTVVDGERSKRRRVTTDERKQIVVAYQNWEREHSSLPIEKRSAPLLPEGISVR